MSSESESFLIRWSRRKLAAERETERQSESAAPAAPAAPPTTSVGDQRAGTEPVPAPALASGTAATTEVPLPPIESLDGLRSDYQAFFQQPVDEGLRRAALTKLFADPHFNQMDMLDVYVDDYTQFEPLSDAMRLRLPSARDFLLDSERAALDAAEARSGATSDAPGALASEAAEEFDPVAAPDPGGEDDSFAVDGAIAGSTSAQAPAPNAAPVDPPSTERPADPADLSSSPASPPDKAAAADHSPS
jgi:hypothetical protein